MALAGFAEFAISARAAIEQADSRVAALARAYVDFARSHRATYEAMFTMTLSVGFASSDTPKPLLDAFGVLFDVQDAAAPETARTVRAEVLWGALHGMCVLEFGSRLDPTLADERLRDLIALFEPNTLQDL